MRERKQASMHLESKRDVDLSLEAAIAASRLEAEWLKAKVMAALFIVYALGIITGLAIGGAL